MAAIRENILTSVTSRDQFLQGRHLAEYQQLPVIKQFATLPFCEVMRAFC